MVQLGSGGGTPVGFSSGTYLLVDGASCWWVATVGGGEKMEMERGGRNLMNLVVGARDGSPESEMARYLVAGDGDGRTWWPW